MNPAIENLEAAKLASLIGSQLKAVDRLTVDRPNLPANRINIEEFVASVKNPNFIPNNKFNNVPSGFAGPPPEDYVQRLVPDAVASYKPPEPSPVIIQNIENVQTIEPKTQTIKPVQIENKLPAASSAIYQPAIYNSFENDMKSIKNSLKNISKCLSESISLFKQQIKNDNV